LASIAYELFTGRYEKFRADAGVGRRAQKSAVPEWIQDLMPKGGEFVSYNESFPVKNKCHHPDKSHEHCCLIIRPESAHAIVLTISRQTDKHPNDGYPIY
jgi:hypothetical protein